MYTPSHNHVANMLAKAGSPVRVGKVDCQAHAGFCQQMNMPHYPTIRLYENGRVHDAPSRDATDIFGWVMGKVPVPVAKDEL